MDLLSINRKIDLTAIFVVILLCVYGLVAVFSATQSNAATSDDPYFFLKKQALAIAIGIIGLLIAAFSNYNKWKAYIVPIYAINIIMLIVVLLIGSTVNNTQGWVSLGPLRLQPSEISKLLLIITLASFFASRKGQIDSYQDLVLSVAHVGAPLLLVLAQPDLGTATCYIAILIGMMVVAGSPLRHFALVAAGGITASILALKLGRISEYQINRLVVFINPDIEPSGIGYQLLQSKIAVGSGQLFGKGLFSGTQARLQFLPERHTDFIFSVIGEEAGFIGASFLLILFFIIVMRGLRTAAFARNLFGTLLATGIVSLWLYQIIVNVGMTIGLMPITGIPLPFISYANSSLIAHLAAVGILLSVYARRYV